MRILGIDPSLTGTGLCATTTTNPAATSTETVTTALRGHDRIDRILKEVAEWARVADLAVIEGPSYGSVGGQAHERAGLWWLIVHDILWRKRIPYAVVTPSQRMLYATGKGRADKDVVLAAVVRRYTGVQVANNNESDALLFAAMACDHHGQPIVAVPQANRAALAKVAWPEAPATQAKAGVA